MRLPPLVAAACLSCITDAWTPPTRTDAAVADVAPVADVPEVRCADPAVIGLVSGYRGHSCVIRCDGRTWCWGINSEGQLGDGTTTTRRLPVRLTGLPRRATALGLGYDAGCAVLDDGSVWCWGRGGDGGIGAPDTPRSNVPVPVRGLTDPAVSVAVGGTHFCAVLQGGGLACWGENGRGQLGLDGNSPRSTATRVTTVVDEVVEVVGGQFHTCARLQRGTVSCWGQNVFGTLADGTFVDRSAPQEVPLQANAVALATLANHVCAALDNGTAWCWGYNNDGQLGNGSRTLAARPVAAAPAPPPTSRFSAGSNHTCALSEDGEVRCWGGNEFGQLGDGTTTRHTRPGAVVALPAAATHISTGNGFTCAALRDGRVFCWGDNANGNLGDGTAQTSPTPVAVLLP
ncbi:MAG: hypothetical protein U0325_13670 [Polyangiales bacterium]